MAQSHTDDGLPSATNLQPPLEEPPIRAEPISEGQVLVGEHEDDGDDARIVTSLVYNLGDWQ